MTSLIIFALIDSLSVGTLVIPLILLLQPQIHWKILGTYCAVLGLFYFVLGALLLLGLNLALSSIAPAIDSQIGLWAQLIIGGLLTIWVLPYLLPEIRKFLPRQGAAKPARPGIVTRWEARLAGKLSVASIIGIALLAGVIEAATMAPYIAATGVLSASSITLSEQLLILAGYCMLMFTPTLFLTAARCLGGNRFDPQLTKLKGWFGKQVAENTPLLIGAVGIVMVLYSSNQLFR